MRSFQKKFLMGWQHCVRGKKELKKIDEYEIEDEVQYLGIKIGGRGRNIFLAENKIWLQKVEKKANELVS